MKNCSILHGHVFVIVLIKFKDITLLLLLKNKCPFNLKTLQAYKPFQYQGTHNIATSTTILYVTNKVAFSYSWCQTELSFILGIMEKGIVY